MSTASELMSFVKGDELNILNILEDQNVAQRIIKRIQKKLHDMQAHSCMYGQVMTQKGIPTNKEKERYIQLLNKNEEIISKNQLLKDDIRELKKQLEKKQRIIDYYDNIIGKEKPNEDTDED